MKLLRIALYVVLAIPLLLLWLASLGKTADG